MFFIQVAMVILAIIAFVAIIFNIEDGVKDNGHGRQNLIISVLLCILMGLGANTIAEYRDDYSRLWQQNTVLTQKVEAKTMRLEKSLNETIKLTQNIQGLQKALEKEQREKADIDAQLNTAHSALVVANEKMEKIQKLLEN